MWQWRRLGVYEHVQHLRARNSGERTFANGKSPLSEVIEQFMAERCLTRPKDSAPDVPTAPVQPVEKSNDELLLELGKLVTLEHLDQELEVEAKLQAKIDRLFKRFFQIRGLKSLMSSEKPSAPALVTATPTLELTATDASNSSGLVDPATEFDGATADEVKSTEA
jgi:hypothetical protein